MQEDYSNFYVYGPVVLYTTPTLIRLFPQKSVYFV